MRPHPDHPDAALKNWLIVGTNNNHWPANADAAVLDRAVTVLEGILSQAGAVGGGGDGDGAWWVGEAAEVAAARWTEDSSWETRDVFVRLAAAVLANGAADPADQPSGEACLGVLVGAMGDANLMARASAARIAASLARSAGSAGAAVADVLAANDAVQALLVDPDESVRAAGVDLAAVLVEAGRGASPSPLRAFLTENENGRAVMDRLRADLDWEVRAATVGLAARLLSAASPACSDPWVGHAAAIVTAALADEDSTGVVWRALETAADLTDCEPFAKATAAAAIDLEAAVEGARERAGRSEQAAGLYPIPTVLDADSQARAFAGGHHGHGGFGGFGATVFAGGNASDGEDAAPRDCY